MASHFLVSILLCAAPLGAAKQSKGSLMRSNIGKATSTMSVDAAGVTSALAETRMQSPSTSVSQLEVDANQAAKRLMRRQPDEEQKEGKKNEDEDMKKEQDLQPGDEEYEKEEVKHGGQDPMEEGLSAEDKEKMKEQRALVKAEALVQTLKNHGDADPDKANHLEHELLNGEKGEKVMEELEDIEDTAKPGDTIDQLIKLRVLMTEEDNLVMRRYELNDPGIQNKEVSDQDAMAESNQTRGAEGDEDEGEGDEDEGDDLAESEVKAVSTDHPIMKMLTAEEHKNLLYNLEKNGHAEHVRHFHKLNKTHHLFVGMKTNGSGPNRNRVWPKTNGRVDIKYCKGPGIGNRGWQKFKEGASDLNEVCEALIFQEVSAGKNCNIKIRGDDDGCWAYLGYRNGNNEIHLKPGGCETKGIATHEMLHALGQLHEQARTDRQVTVYTGNIEDGKESQFETNAKESTLDSYDLSSIMHYSCSAFSKNGQYTMRGHRRRSFWDGAFGNADCWYHMGNRAGMTSNDIGQLQRMYSCSSRRRAPPPSHPWWCFWCR